MQTYKYDWKYPDSSWGDVVIDLRIEMEDKFF